MNEPSPPQARRARPAWFRSHFDRHLKASFIQLGEADAAAFVGELRGTLDSSRFARIWDEFCRLRLKAARDLEKSDWSRLSGYDLVLHLEASLWAHLAVTVFLPKSYRWWPFPARRDAFSVALMQANQNVECPAAWFLPPEFASPFSDMWPEMSIYERGLGIPVALTEAVALYPVIRAELQQRRPAIEHIGVHMAALATVMQVAVWGHVEPRRAEDIERESLAQLRRCVVPQIGRGTRWRITETEGRRSREAPAAADPVGRSVDRQAAFVAGELNRKMDALELLARGLEGHLDIAPRRVANRVTNEARIARRWMDRELLVDSNRTTDQAGEIRISLEEMAESLPGTDADPPSVERRDDILDADQSINDFIRTHPRYRKGIDILLNEHAGVTLTELAKRYQTSVPAVSKRRDKAQAALARWLMGRYLAGGSPQIS